jgi:hypothetical protein
MGPVWLGVRAELRLRWRALVGLALLLGLAVRRLRPGLHHPMWSTVRGAPQRCWPLAENEFFAAEGWCACSQGQGRNRDR